jgi:hypothetical protein
MRATVFRHRAPAMKKRFVAVLLVLASLHGCKPDTPPPTRPGVSIPLSYPVLLIGQSSLDVRDSQEALTSIPGASSLNLVERWILDSEGRLFDVKRALLVEGQRSIAWDMGTSARHYFVEVSLPRRPAWSEIEALVLEQVRSPAGIWAGDERAVRRVRSLRDAGALIDASREAWNWAR